MGGWVFIGADIFSKDLEKDIRVINVYGPYQNRETYWRRLFSTFLLQADDVILGGDLNFSMGFMESWGHMA